MRGDWVRKPRDDATVVFVHGILSSGETCWMSDNGAWWPELVAQEPQLDALGIYVYTYQTGLFSGTYSLDDIVDDLKERLLTLDRVAENNRRLVFVCHSMGGIVVRKFLIERVNDLLDRNIEVGLYLVASPSLGSDYANWLEPMAEFLGHTQAEVLRFSQDNLWLNGLDKEFRNLKESGRLRMQGKELVEDKFIFLKRFWRKQVVPPFAGAHYFGEPYKVPGADHFSISKPENSMAVQHRLLVAFIDTLASTTAPSSVPLAQPTIPDAASRSAESSDRVHSPPSRAAILAESQAAPIASGIPAAEQSGPIRLFYSYAHEDELLRNQLEKHLSTLKRQKIIREWHDRKIISGQSWANQIDRNLESADVILLLISVDFVASDYCHEVEMRSALERHRQGQAKVVPILLRPTDLEGLPFGELQGLPTDLKPVTTWANQDEAFFDIVQGLRKLIAELRPDRGAGSPLDPASSGLEPAAAANRGPTASSPPDVCGRHGTLSPAASDVAAEDVPARRVQAWQRKLKSRLADQLGDPVLDQVVRGFARRLREDKPDLGQNIEDVAEHLVNGPGDRHKRIAQFLSAVSEQGGDTAATKPAQELLAYLLHTLVRKCQGANDRGLTRIAVNRRETVELVNASRTTTATIPGPGEDREHRNGQRDGLLGNVGHFLPESGDWDIESVCRNIAQELLISLGDSANSVQDDPLRTLEGRLSAYVDAPENAPLHGVVVKQHAGFNPLQIDKVAERLRQALGDPFWVYVYGGQESADSPESGEWLHTTEERIGGLVKRYRTIIDPDPKTTIHQSSEASKMSNAGINLGAVGPGATVNIVTGTQMDSQVGQGNVGLSGADTTKLVQLLADLRARAGQADDIDKQDYAAIDRASETIEAEVLKPEGASRSALMRARAVLDRFKDVAGIAGAIEKITTVLAPFLT